MNTELVEKILNNYKKDEILYEAFRKYLAELKMELRKDAKFINENTNVLDDLIAITKAKGMVFTYRIKILNNIKDFDIKEVYKTRIINNIDDITEDSVEKIIEKYIKDNFL